MSTLIFFIILGYAMVILLLSKEFITYSSTPLKGQNKLHCFTVVINYRNEQDKLPGLLTSIAQLDYDLEKLHFIFINDAATDCSLSILETFKAQNPNFSIELIDRKPRSNSGKKDGIAQAVALSPHNHIITTDADCVLPIQWIACYNAIYNRLPDAHFIAAPVQIESKDKWLQALQHQEMLALQLVTVGGFSLRQPFMCNGANMSFTKKAFNEVDGYKGNLHISSGDDVFLLEKLAAEDVMKCHFLKNKHAIITTFPKNTFNEVVAQRARWAQKGKETKSMLNKLVSFQVLIMSIAWVIGPVLWQFTFITEELFIAIILIKLFTDLVVLIIGNLFFAPVQWKYVAVNFCIYPFVVIIIAFKTLYQQQWQGRKTNSLKSQQE